MTTAAGLVSLLNEKNETLVHYALVQLNDNVDSYWTEISDYLEKIESLSETKAFQHHSLAGLLAAKTHYHLGALEEATTYALNAGDMFDLNYKSEFVATMIAQCIQKYISGRRNPDSVADNVVFWRQLEKTIENIFTRCLNAKEYKEAIGIALESHRIDIVEKAIQLGNTSELLNYVFICCSRVVQDRMFRTKLLQLLVRIFSQIENPDYLAMVICLVMLNEPDSCAAVLNRLVNLSEANFTLALQAAFDVEDVACQGFLKKMSSCIVESSVAPLIRNILSGHVRTLLHSEFLSQNNHSDIHVMKTSRNCLDSRSSLQHSSVSFANAIMYAGTSSDQFIRDSLEWLHRANNWCKFSATAALGVIYKGQVEQSLEILNPYLPFNGVAAGANPNASVNAQTHVYSEGGALFALGLINANHAEVLPYFFETLERTSNEVLQYGCSIGMGCAALGTGDERSLKHLNDILQLDNAVSSDGAALGIGMSLVGTGNLVKLHELVEFAHQTQHERIIRSIGLSCAFIMFGLAQDANDSIDYLLADKDALLRYGGVYMIAMAYAATNNIDALRKLLHIAVSDVDDNVRRAAITAIGFLYLDSPQDVPSIVKLFVESYNPYMRYGACMALGIASASQNTPEAVSLLNDLKTDSVDFVRQGALIAQGLVQIQQNNITSFREHLSSVVADKRETPLCKLGAVLSQGIIDAGGRNCSISLRSREGILNVPAVLGMTLFLQYWNWFPLTHFLSFALRPTALIALDKEFLLPKFEFLSKAKPSIFAYPAVSAAPVQEKIERVHAMLSTSAKASARARRRGSAPLFRTNMSKNTLASSAGNTPVPIHGESMDIDPPENRNEQEQEPQKKMKDDGSSKANLASITDTTPAEDRMDIDSIDTKQQSSTTPNNKNTKAKTEEGVEAVERAVSSSSSSTSSSGPDAEKVEVNFEYKSNFSRVLPAQERFISFSESLYQPLKKAKTSGILLVEKVGNINDQDYIKLKYNLKAPRRNIIDGFRTSQAANNNIGTADSNTGPPPSSVLGSSGPANNNPGGARFGMPAPFDYTDNNGNNS